MENDDFNYDAFKNLYKNIGVMEEQVMHEIEILNKLCDHKIDDKKIEPVSDIFIDFYSEYLEYISYKDISSKLLKNLAEKINKNTLMYVDNLTLVLDSLLKGKIRPSSIVKNTTLREASCLNLPFRIENMFCKENDVEVKKVKTPVFSRLINKSLLDPYMIIKDKVYVGEELEYDENFILRSLFIFISTVFMFFEDKEVIEKKIREQLSVRLLTKTYLSLELEKEFIDTMKNLCKYVYVYKLEDILSDFKDRKIFGNSEILFIRTFQWPSFLNNTVVIDELEELKNSYTNNILVHEKRKVKWIDYLSSVNIEIDNIEARVSLIQYRIILNIQGNRPIADNTISEEERKIYEDHLKELLEKNILVKQDNKYFVNSFDNFSVGVLDCVPKKCYLKNDPSVDKEGSDNKYKLYVLDCRIMKEVKKIKKISIFELKELLTCDSIILKSRILEMEKKGYLELKDDMVHYLP